eukprot:scaffold9342_cov163-Cylindrotheca_fusiformis.AAC.1
MSSSSDDFFQNPLSSPPKQSTALNRRPSESNKPKTRTATTRRAPPPPPKPSSSGAASASGTAATTVTNRRRPAASSTGTSSAASGRSSYKSTRSIPSSAATTLKPKAASASTVPTSFYGSSPSTAPAGDRSDTGLYGFSSNVSNTAAAASASTNSLNNNSTNSQPQWDSWAAPPASASTTSTTSNTDWGSTSNTDWGAPAPSASNAPMSNDSAGGWFTGGTTSTNSATSAADPALTQWQAPNPAAPMPSSSSSLQGSMDTTSTPATMAPMAPNIFQPQDFIGTTTSNNMDDEDFENEPPLLEELGIHFDHILLKTKTVCWPFQRTSSGAYDENEMVDAVVQDADLIGPICYCLLLGGEMVLTGKLQFGYIYGFGLFGCIAMTLVVNLTAPQDAVSFWVVASVLGYALIPVNILALVKVIVINLASLQTLGRFLAVVTVAWSTTAATRLLEMGCGLRQQRYLIAYPIALLYSAFVLITIF